MKIPTPADAVRLAEQSRQAISDAIALVPRLVAIVGEVEQLMARVQTVVTSVEQIEQRAARTVARTDEIVDRIDPMIGSYEQSLKDLAPVVERLAETTDPREVDAMVKLIDELPEIVSKVDSDILPILDTLNTVAPDLRELLTVSKELNDIITSIPGLHRKRSEEDNEQARAEGASKHSES